MNTITVYKGDAPLGLANRCGGYYKCPKGPDGKRLGPLVGYSQRYDGKNQWVGDEYINFAMVERHASAREWVADELVCRLLAKEEYPGELTRGAGFCGAPEGGKALAVELSRMLYAQYICPPSGAPQKTADRKRT